MVYFTHEYIELFTVEVTYMNYFKLFFIITFSLLVFIPTSYATREVNVFINKPFKIYTNNSCVDSEPNGENGLQLKIQDRRGCGRVDYNTAIHITKQGVPGYIAFVNLIPTFDFWNHLQGFKPGTNWKPSGDELDVSVNNDTIKINFKEKASGQ